MAAPKNSAGKTPAVFVDGNWLLHRVQYTKGVSSSVPHKVVPMNVLNYCCVYALSKGASHGALLLDGSENFRYKVYPEYKANRNGGGSLGTSDHEDQSDSVYANLEPTIRLFQLVGFPVFQEPEYEADDMLVAGANRFIEQSPDHFSWIVCRDKDSFQAVRERIHVFWPEVGKIPSADVDSDYVRKKTGMSPKTFGDYQILVGDQVDNVPGIIKPSLAKSILSEHDLLINYFRTKEGRKFFLRYETELRRNQRLVRMDQRCWSPSPEELQLSLKEDRRVVDEFGTLPKSFYALRSMVSGSRRSLFGV